MKKSVFKKPLALIAASALMLTSVFTGITASADSASAADIIAATKFAKKPIYEVDFTKYGKGQAAPSDWIGEYEYPFLWRANGSYINKLLAENYDDDGMGLKYGAVKKVNIVTLPELNTENYVVTVEASFKSGNNDGSFGIATDIPTDHTTATYASVLEVFPSTANFKVFTRTRVKTWSEDKNVSNMSFADAGCFADNTLADFQKFTLKAYHINDVTYFYCNDKYVGEVEDYGNAFSDRIGLYSNAGLNKIYSVKVNGLAGEGPKAVTTARVNNGDPIYSQDFDSLSKGSRVMPSDWVNYQHSFLYRASNAMDNLSYGVWKDDELNTQYMTYKSSGGAHIMTLPAMGTENYVYTVKAKSQNNNEVGIVTNIRNDYQNTKSASIFELRPSESKFKAYSRKDDGSSGQDVKDSVTTVNFTDDDFFTDDTFVPGSMVEMTAYHINDITYFYFNGKFAASVDDYSNDGLCDRVGLYTYGGELSIFEVTVKEIMPEVSDIAERTFASKTLVSEDFSKYSVDSELPAGWAKNSNSWIWKGANGEVGFYNKLGYTALLVNGYKSTGVVTLPTLGTSNYVFTAEIVVRDTECFGLLTNIDDPADTSTGATHSLLYTEKDTENKTIYQYNREGSNQLNKQLFDEAKAIGKIPGWNETYTLTAYSFEGVTYFFVNGKFISSIEQRNPTSTSLCGIYSCGGSILVKSASVSAISGIGETDSLKMQGAQIRYADVNGRSETAGANGIRFIASFDTEDKLYNDNFDNIELGMMIIPSLTLAGKALTAQTEGAYAIKLEKPAVMSGTVALNAEIFNMGTAALGTPYAVRAYMLINNGESLSYYYSEQITRSPVSVANNYYADPSIEISDYIKSRLNSVFGNCEDYLGENDKTLTFTAFSDFHYKQGMYAATVEGLQRIIDRAGQNNSEFILQCGDFSNDTSGSPELINTYLNNSQKLPVYGIYGNHELETAGNTMDKVTPTLTNRANNVVWGTEDGKIGDGSIGYYYFDNEKGFRVVCLDINYSWNTSKSIWEHNRENSYGPPSENINGDSLGPVQLSWLEDVLTDAAQKGISCIVTAHTSISGTLPTVSPDGEAIRAIFRKVNNIRPKTVVLVINGDLHRNQIAVVDGVVHFEVNTANNGYWRSNKEGTQHYTEDHTFEYVKYDDNGNPVSTETVSLTELSGSPSTWYFANPLSATVKVTKSGIVEINGMDTDWIYGVEPPEKIQYIEPKISSGIFGGKNEIRENTLKEKALESGIAYNKDNRVLVWHEEFDGDALDSSSFGFERSMDNSDIAYSNDAQNVKVCNGNLVLKANRTENGYTTAEGLSTKKTMAFKYGYLEMRARVPYSHGAWPSLWAKSSPAHHEENVGWGAEVDIFEVFSSTNKLYPNLHKYGHNQGPHYDIQSTALKSNGYTFADGADLNDYHIYGFEWTKDYMKFYVDGVCYQTYDLNADYAADLPGMDGYREYIYLLINNELFTQNSDWKAYAGCEITDSDPMPEYSIDYIRLYQDIQNESVLTVK